MKQLRNILMAILLSAASLASAAAQDVVRFKLSAGTIGQNALRTGIEQNAAALLTEINRAEYAGDTKLDYSGIDITPDAQTNLNDLWEYTHLRVVSNEAQQGKIFLDKPCLKIPHGYQVSPITVVMRNADGTGKAEDSAIAINFNERGTIVDVSITLSTEQYEQLMRAGLSDVRDEYARTMIAYWMGQLKNAYQTMDINFFETLLSDDAVIITGTRRMQRANTEVALKMSSDQFVYYKRTKEEYLDHLRRKVFLPNHKIRMEYGDDERIKQSTSKPRYYIVDVTQLWYNTNLSNNSTYHDEGRLFVLWDFANPDEPKILARIWQAKEDDKRWDFIDFENLE